MSQLVIGLILPLLGTVLGAGMVFLIDDHIDKRLEKFLMGFASGVMIAASIWSLIIPSMDMAQGPEKLRFIPAAVGFLLGIFMLLGLDSLIPHLHPKEENPEGIPAKIKKTTMLILAVTIHNIPEGMAVGVTLAGALYGNNAISWAGALALCIGIALQNFPEGAIISMPLVTQGISKKKSFMYGALSGIVEPIGAIITILLTRSITTILPYFLSFAAGAMIYVVMEELVPDSKEGEHSNLSIIGVAFGFVIMMVLDVALG